MVIRLCAVVLVSVQRNEAAIVRLLTVSARLSGKKNGCGVLPGQGVLSWLMVHIDTVQSVQPGVTDNTMKQYGLLPGELHDMVLSE